MQYEERLSRLLPGTWKLESRIDVTRSGQRRSDPLLGEDPVALLIYDRSGHFAAQFMKRDRSTLAPEVSNSPANNTFAQGGYDAYFGTYSVDDATGVVVQRLEAALTPANVGMALTRSMQVRANRLVIRLDTIAADGAPIVRTLTWRRLSS